MGKIKLNLVSGAVVEKPLINAFKANNNSYVVFDNEMNGSMGLPIILVCKLENNKLIKIIDQGEWQIVKEYLKNIIAGNQIEFISVNNELAADDIYYTQLTLPVPSFDALKKAYKVETNNTVDAGISNMFNEPVVNVTETAIPVQPVMPQFEVPTQEVAPVTEPAVNPSAPVIDFNIPVQNVTSAPEVNVEPAIDLSTPIPTFGESSQTNMTSIEPVMSVEPVTPIMPEPEITPTPVVETVVSNASNEVSVFSEQKEAFMQACENMFDALVQKFEKELENRK